MVQERRLPIRLAHEVLERLILSGALRTTVNSLLPFLQIVNAKKQVEEVQDAAVIIFPEEAIKLAKALSRQAADIPGIGPVTRHALETRFMRFLEGYEDIFEIKPGQNLLRYLQRCYGDEWKILFNGQLRTIATVARRISATLTEYTKHVAVNVTPLDERSKLRSNPKFRTGDATWLGEYIHHHREHRRTLHGPRRKK